MTSGIVPERRRELFSAFEGVCRTALRLQEDPSLHPGARSYGTVSARESQSIFSGDQRVLSQYGRHGDRCEVWSDTDHPGNDL